MYIFVLKQGRDYSSLLSHMMDLWKSGASMQQEINLSPTHLETHFEDNLSLQVDAY